MSTPNGCVPNLVMHMECVTYVLESRYHHARVYTRKTSWGLSPLEVLERAAKIVREGKKSFRAPARDGKNRPNYTGGTVPLTKRKRMYVFKNRGYDNVAETHKVLSGDMDSALAKHIKNLTGQFHGFKMQRT